MTICIIATLILAPIVLGMFATCAEHDRADEARERTEKIIAIVRSEQRAPFVVQRNLERRREREIQRARWPSLERIYKEIEDASDA